MKTREQLEQDIADRDRMIERLKTQLTKALEAVAKITVDARTPDATLKP
jgi:hypothetical protein